MLLFFEFFDFLQKRLYFFDSALLTEGLSLVVENLNLLFELLNFLVDVLLLKLVHLIRCVILLRQTAHGSALRPSERALDLHIDGSDHGLELSDEFVLVAAFVLGAVGVRLKLLLEEVVVALFAGANVRFRVRKEVVRAKSKQVEFADLKHTLRNIKTYVWVVEVVSAGDPDKEGLVPVLAHELVELLPNEVHFLSLKN